LYRGEGLGSLVQLRQSLRVPAGSRGAAIPFAQYCGRFTSSGSFVAREKIGSGASARLILIIDVTERSPVGIADDETRAVVVDRPRGREMAGGHRPDHANEP
jgi:hypothetical protein